MLQRWWVLVPFRLFILCSTSNWNLFLYKYRDLMVFRCHFLLHQVRLLAPSRLSWLLHLILPNFVYRCKELQVHPVLSRWLRTEVLQIVSFRHIIMGGSEVSSEGLVPAFCILFLPPVRVLKEWARREHYYQMKTHSLSLFSPAVTMTSYETARQFFHRVIVENRWNGAVTG